MELKAIDTCRVVLLTTITRKAGQLYLPKVMRGLVNRYNFQKLPTAEQFGGETLTFQIGEFGDTGIQELSIYNDGLIVASHARTEILDEFVDDLLSWASAEFGITETGITKREKHYDSAVIVGMDVKPNSALKFLSGIESTLTKRQTEYGLRPFSFDFGGFSVAADTTAYTGRNPTPFSFARRINVPFEDGIYYSVAPLKTDHHLELLENLERTMR